MAQPLYKDLNKRSNDLLTKDYPSDSKVEYAAKAFDGGNLEANFVTRKDGTSTLVVTPKWRFLVNKQPVNALLELSSKKDLKGEVTVEPTAVKDVKVVATATVKEGDLTETVNAEYRHESVTANVNVDFKAKGVNSKASLVFGNRNFSLGALAEYFFDKNGTPTPQEYSVTTSYRHPNRNLDVGLFGRQSHRGSVKNEVGLHFFQKVNNEVALGGNVVFDTNAPNDRPRVEVAASYAPDANNAFKAKTNGNGQVSVAFQQRLNSRTKLTLSTTTDTQAFSSFPGKGASNVGFVLNFSE
eukprot:TRINITY_DN12886_c0_g1_i1.p1 TRINITY_DN12886_c0_g1~~TRINITY_DN12886_c0_g1_i1.p1  ORF type:complete len:298 (-),score=113.45 TRINITY_DN12886_c0_g1_i1:68-961(-)